MKALFLDFDGTLADSISVLYQTYLGFLKGRGVKGSWEEFCELNGYSMEQIFDVFRRRYGFDASENLGEMHQQLFLESYREHVPLFDGTLDFLHQVKEAGVRMAIVTAATRELVEAFLNRHGILDLFETIITPEELETSKPDPEIYFHALDTMGLSPEDVWTVEDSPHGIAASLAAKIPTIAITHRESLEPIPNGVAHIAKNWDDVLSIVRGEVVAT